MIIRPMAREDAEAIHEIHSACLTRTLLGRYTHEQITAWMDGRTPEGYVRASEAGERFFVAEADGVVVGYASWEDDELLSLFVQPDYHSRGVGSALVETCLVDAESTGGAITKVKSVLGAEAFYAKHGFAPEGRGKHREARRRDPRHKDAPGAFRGSRTSRGFYRNKPFGP